jgi:hypothetical protein
MPEQLELFPRFPLAPPPTDAPLTDAPLTDAELTALSRLGWEHQGERTSRHGLTLVRLRDDRSDDRLYTEERTPGGWRVLLREEGAL